MIGLLTYDVINNKIKVVPNEEFRFNCDKGDYIQYFGREHQVLYTNNEGFVLMRTNDLEEKSNEKFI